MKPMNDKARGLKSFLTLSAFVLFAAVPAISFAQSSAKPQPHDLSDAVLQGDVQKTKQLIKLGADVQVLDDRTNPNGRYPLNWAAFQGNVEIINALLDAKA